MRSAIVALVLLGMSSPAFAQGLLTVDEIYKMLPGVWSMETASTPGGERKTHCDTGATRIRFETDSQRGMMYVSEWLGKLDPDQKREDHIVRSPVRVAQSPTGAPSRAIILQYDDEKRLDDQGKPVVWYLVMQDKDTFLWHRADWAPDGFTAPSHRCPDPNLVG